MKRKIMLVDDIEISNIIMKKMIGMLSQNVEIFDFTDPRQAFKELKVINPDLIFLDLNMPYIDGWQFLEKMKNDNYSYKVIVLTSSSSILDKERSREFSNVVSYCEKPLRKEKLLGYLTAQVQDYNSLVNS